MDWKRPDPQQNGSIFVQKPNLVNNEPGIDEVKATTPREEPHLIPDDDDDGPIPDLVPIGDENGSIL